MKKLFVIATAALSMFNQAEEVSPVDMSDALDNKTLSFTTGGDSPWFTQIEQSYDGVSAAQSGALGNNQTNWLETTVFGPGTISFWWYVSCEGNKTLNNLDYLAVYIDDVEQSRICGVDNEWECKSYDIPAGAHNIRWVYSKDRSQESGFDAGFVDQVAWDSPLRAVIFDANGGQFSNGMATRIVGVEPGNLWGKLPMPMMDGQVFVGWYTAQDGGELVTASSQVPSQSATYYAHWTRRLGLAEGSEWTGAFATDCWCGQGAVTHDGRDALRSGIIYDGQNSYIQTRVTGAGTLTFWWKVSCEGGGNDVLRFLVDSSQKYAITGETDWTKVTVTISDPGTHTLKWNYTKNGSITKGNDFGWLDQIIWAAQ